MRVRTQLTQEQRYQINALMMAEHNKTGIVAVVGVDKSTVSREVRCNCGLRGYHSQQTHQSALNRRQTKITKHITRAHWRFAERRLREDRSLERVSLWLAAEGRLADSHERIYQHVLEDKSQDSDLYRRLRCQKQRRKRYGSYDWHGQLCNELPIEYRPAIMERRSRLGDWELGTIIGKGHRQALISLVERKSCLVLLAKVLNKGIEAVKQAVLKLLNPLVVRVHTVTSGNGKEFASHEAIAAELYADFYFAHPYVSWGHGLNKITNGLIRQSFPKDCEFTAFRQSGIRRAVGKLNNRWRRWLGVKISNQIFFGINPLVALVS